MKLIKTLSERVTEEIGDARYYIKMALEVKDEHPELARTLYTISQQEMDHMTMLHTSVVDIIEKYRATNGEPPAAMMAVYEYLHEQQINSAAEVKAMQSLYKG